MAVRIALAVAAVVAVLLVAAQLLLPGRVADGIEDRLTEGGGSAEVAVEALPAATLVFGEGDRIEVRGSDLDLDVTEETEVLDRLDGFDEVDVALQGVVAGPLDVDDFVLAREGGDVYRLRTRATTTGTELLEYGAQTFAPLAGPIVGAFSDRAPAAARETVPVELDMELASDDGRIEVVSGGGTIAGFDAGPLAEIVTAAVVSRL
jgi:hypothetical protein